MKLAFFCLIVCIHGIALAIGDGACFRALIVGNTLDRKIGVTCVSDVYRLKKSLHTIASQINMKLEILILDDKKCLYKDMKRWIQQQHVASDDVIWVYFTGHGAPDCNQSLWPQIGFRDTYARSAEIQDMIRRLPCRLSILFLDCCNGYGPRKRSDKDHYLPILRNNKSWSGLRPLFKYFRGFITVCAADRGEEAGCIAGTSDRYWGGYGTTGFLVALKELGKDPNVTWERVLHRAREYAIAVSNGKQHAIATIETR